LFDLDIVGGKMGLPFLKRRIRQETYIRRPRRGLAGMGGEFPSSLMQIDFALTEQKRPAPAAIGARELFAPHPKNLGIKPNGLRNIGNRQHQMIQDPDTALKIGIWHHLVLSCGAVT
jgi:hypothetical protein